MMDSWDLKRWRKRFGYNQYEAADQLGVGRNTIQNWEAELRPIPHAVELACIELARRWKQRPEFGPVLLVYADGLARDDGTDAAWSSLLHCEPHPSNEAAIRRALGLRDGPELLDPLLIFILEEDGEIIWAGPKLLMECERRKPQAPRADRAPRSSDRPSAKVLSKKRGRKRAKPGADDWWRRFFKTDVNGEKQK